jgi:hypothetical protein
VTIDVKGHPDIAVSHQRLDFLRRETLFDEQARRCMPQAVHAVFRQSPRRTETSSLLRLAETLTAEVVQCFNRPVICREDETGITFGTRKLPFLQGVDDHRGKWDFAPAARALGGADCIPTIGALPDPECTIVQINVFPGEPAQLARSQPGKDSGDD